MSSENLTTVEVVAIVVVVLILFGIFIYIFFGQKISRKLFYKGDSEGKYTSRKYEPEPEGYRI